MKNCLNCGAEARDGAKFCTSCGTPFAVEAVESVVADTQDVVEAQVEEVSSRIDDVETQIEVVSEQVDDVETQIEVVSEQVDDVATQVEVVSEQVEDVATQVDVVSEHVDEVTEYAERTVEHVEAETTQKVEEFVAEVAPEVPAFEPAAPAPPAVGFAAAQVQGMKERLAADQSQSMYEYAAPPAQQPQAQYPQAQPARQAQVQQPYRPAEPVPHGYGFPQQGGQPQAPVATAPQGYGQQAYQPQAQQGVQAPPTYGYPPQAPQPQAQHMQAQYPQAPQQQAHYMQGQQPQAPQQQVAPGYGYPPQGAYAPQAPPAAPKKKRRWVIPVIIIAIVVALLVGAYFVFGDQIKGLFGSKANAYERAEREVTRFDDHRLLGPIKETFNKQAEETKYGGKTSIALEIKGQGTEQVASILDVINKIRLTTEYKVDFSKENPRFQTKIGLGNRDKVEDAIGVNIFNLDNGAYVIDASPILQKPLVLTKEAIEGMLSGGVGSMNPMGIDMMGQLPNVFQSLQKSIGLFSGETADNIVDGIYNIIFKYAEQEEKLKDQELTVGTISQKFDQYNVVVKAEKAPEMLKEILVYLRDNKDVKKIVTELLDPFKKLNISSDLDEWNYEKFVENINEFIEEIDKNPESYHFGVKRTLYVDSKNNPQGGTLIITKPTKAGEKEQNLTIKHVHVEADGQHGFMFFAQPDGMDGIEFKSLYTVKDGFYTGSFELNKYDSFDLNPTNVAKGEVENFGLEADGDFVYPVGNLTIIPTVDETPGMFLPGGIKTSYSGKLESKADGKHLVASVVINLPVEESGPSQITIMIDHRAYGSKDITLDGTMPADYIDLSDQEAFKSMIENDPGIMMRLFQALGELGIDVGSLVPTPGPAPQP